MGEQSPARDRHRRRDRLDDAAECLGRDLAHSEEHYRLDESQRRNRRCDSRESKRMARMAFLASRTNAFLSIPLLFFMAAASHYPMFG